MFKTFWMLAALSMLIALPSVQGQEYSVEVIQQGPDAEKVSADLVDVISDTGYRIKSGSRTTAEIWLCKQWQVDPSFEKSMQRLYPFQPGDLIGMLHLSRRGSDFRDQQMSSGWYTLRFGLQPIDGNHIGTSPTRDFLLMVDASEDAADKDWGEDDLNEASGCRRFGRSCHDLLASPSGFRRSTVDSPRRSERLVDSPCAGHRRRRRWESHEVTD